ncbi:MAG: caspase family protein, partial [Bacteroidales bacterium]|nr:caspase family protein [Bacteroidales bacterium]
MKKLTLFLIVILFAGSLFAQNRGFIPIAEVTGKTSSEIENHYFALIIGNQSYNDNAINNLDEPVNDAQKLYNVLTQEYLFPKKNVVFLKNATYEQMIDVFDNLSNKLTDNDNLLVFYAGHGWWDESKKLGYWLPVDARKNSTAFWIRNSTISDYMSSIKTKHTLLIADACFSGSIFKTRSAFDDAEGQEIKPLYDLPSKNAMTSGNLKEVPDQSKFMEFLVKRLKNNTKKYLPADELFISFRTAVMHNSETEPQYGTIKNAGDEGGEFIFIKRIDATNNYTPKAEVNNGQNTTIGKGVLQLISDYSGIAKISSVTSGTQMQTKNIYAGSTYTFSNLPTGIVVINIYSNNKRLWTSKVHITAGQTTTIKAEKLTGTLQLTAQVSGNFYIDGIARGYINAGTYTYNDLSPSLHTAKLVSKGQTLWNGSFTIIASQTKYLTAKNTYTPPNNTNNNTANSFIDNRDGKTYKTVKIGNQVWMAENLNYTQGIPHVADKEAWAKLKDNNIDQAWCYYDNKAENGKKYGALYTYAAAKNVCPTAWHLPSDAE